MKDGRTHLAHKAEHAVDLETGAVVAVTVQDADEGDTTTNRETLIEAAEQIEAVRPDGGGLQEVVGDRGYHSNQSFVDLEAVGVRGYISEPDRGRRNWKDKPEARTAAYRNRRRIRGPRGLRLLRMRGGASGTALRASLRNRRHAPRPSAGAHQHSQAATQRERCVRPTRMGRGCRPGALVIRSRWKFCSPPRSGRVRFRPRPAFIKYGRAFMIWSRHAPG